MDSGDNCNKCITIVGDVDNEGNCACMGTVYMWEISVPSAQLCCEPKTTTKKIKSILKNGGN